MQEVKFEEKQTFEIGLQGGLFPNVNFQLYLQATSFTACFSLSATSAQVRGGPGSGGGEKAEL